MIGRSFSLHSETAGSIEPPRAHGTFVMLRSLMLQQNLDIFEFTAVEQGGCKCQLLLRCEQRLVACYSLAVPAPCHQHGALLLFRHDYCLS